MCVCVCVRACVGASVCVCVCVCVEKDITLRGLQCNKCLKVHTDFLSCAAANLTLFIDGNHKLLRQHKPT